jgi:hypothetical protein
VHESEAGAQGAEREATDADLDLRLPAGFRGGKYIPAQRSRFAIKRQVTIGDGTNHRERRQKHGQQDPRPHSAAG